MINQHLIDSPVFSFRIGSSEQDGGEAIFGGIDHSAYTGPLRYVPVRRKAYWEVELPKISFGGDELELENTGAAIDTGNSQVQLDLFTMFNCLQEHLSSHFPLTSLRCSTLKLVPRSPGTASIRWTALRSPTFLSSRSSSEVLLILSKEVTMF